MHWTGESNGQGRRPVGSIIPAGQGDSWAGHYQGIANSGRTPGRTQTWWGSAMCGIGGPATAGTNGPCNQPLDGMFYRNSKVTFGTLSDGSSNTLAFSEHVGNQATGAQHPWGNYAGGLTTVNGINANFKSVPRLSGWRFNDSPFTGPSSFHVGGAQFAMGDGSIHFISESLDRDTLRNLTTTSGGEVASLPQ